MGTLHRLVRANDLEGIRQLLGLQEDVGAVVNEIDDDGLSPLFYAVAHEHSQLEIVEALLLAGADAGFESLRELSGITVDDLKGSSDLLAEHGFELPEMFNVSFPTQERRVLVREAIKVGHVEVVSLLHAHGADLSYQDENGYTAVLDAVYGLRDRLPIVEYLISLDLDVNSMSSYGESPVGTANRLGRFSVVKALLDAGADESQLSWSPLIRSVALGTHRDVEEVLARQPNINERDVLGRSALDISLLKGDLGIAKLLRAHGASLEEVQDSESLLSFAVKGGNLEAVEWLVQQGADVESRDKWGATALASAVGEGNLGMVRSLLNVGADPNAEMEYDTILRKATDREILLILLEHGADPANLNHDGRRVLLGLGEPNADLLYEVSREQYLAGRFPREGTGNSEELDDPFKLAMIRAGVNAYWAREKFDDPATFSCGLRGTQPSPVWCADRFGQTLTILPDGRIVLIAGEHEDSYDPDFCIYNDVFVASPDGQVRIFAYPYAVFPPTDFHTATLVGSDIFIIGSLGYAGKRRGGIPVFRLNTDDFHIESVKTSGQDPGRIFGHRSQLIAPHTIRVSGGTRITFKRSEEIHQPNDETFQLDLMTRVWVKV